jgi:DNA-binding transcriptional LysR family regulator
MDPRSLRNLDLNLLVTFAVLMRERHVSRAARVLGISQPGLSGALARLREALGDPLLVRVGTKLQPTPRALELVVPVEEALALLARATSGVEAFDPFATTRTFSVGMTDDHELLFAAPLAVALERAAPRARLVIRASDVHSTPGLLDDASLDVSLGAVRPDKLAAWHTAEPLFRDGYACVSSPRRLTIPKRLTLDAYTRLPHALVTFDGGLSSHVDEVLARANRRRSVVIGVPRFGALPAVLAARPLVATVPVPVAQLLACKHGLVVAALPIDLPPRDYGLIYRRRDAALAELLWFRALLASAIATARADLERAHTRTRRRA